MKVVTARQMRHIDQVTIQERGIPAGVLMDRAGRAVTREALERFEPDSVAVITGKGNNAGDGFVAARELHRRGIKTVIYLLALPDELSGDALNAWHQVPDDLPRIARPTPQTLREQLIQYDLAIDAIFGIGARAPLNSPWSDYIEAINACRVNMLSIDIPSGLAPDGGEKSTRGIHVKATATLTIGLPKLGLVVDPGVRSAGVVAVDDIGFPHDLLESPKITTNLMTLDDARLLLPRRNPAGHKGTFGRVMILGGSEGLTGAAVLAARAAARSGAGLVYAAYPAPLGTIMESHLIEPVKIPLEGPETWFVAHHASRAIEEARAMQAVALGPGLGRRPDSQKFLKEIVANVVAPLVIDADGLNLLAEHRIILSRRPGPTVLTPHPGEAARLLGCTVEEVEANRFDAFLELSKEYGAVIVLKGTQTVITEPDGQRYLNPTGNSGLAKGGSGDVLTGLIAGLLAQGLAAGEAARLGVFLHGLAADETARELGVRAMLPSDVIARLATAFKLLEN